ncbi:MAG: hypothetical protein UCJ19_15640, partial [Oscillospiraceae bacterium]|nr:hypothetical protein [Oscillospiraceae bacterium]
GFFPKISEQSEEIFCFRAGERAFAFPLRGEGKQIPCGNLLDEVESFPLTLQRQNAGGRWSNFVRASFCHLISHLGEDI